MAKPTLQPEFPHFFHTVFHVETQWNSIFHTPYKGVEMEKFHSWKESQDLTEAR